MYVSAVSWINYMRACSRTAIYDVFDSVKTPGIFNIRQPRIRKPISCALYRFTIFVVSVAARSYYAATVVCARIVSFVSSTRRVWRMHQILFIAVRQHKLATSSISTVSCCTQLKCVIQYIKHCSTDFDIRVLFVVL